MAPRIAAVVAAAGSGQRLGHALPKALVPLAGTPILVHTLRSLAATERCDHIVIAVPESARDQFIPVIASAGLAIPLTVVAGDSSRQRSVLRALRLVPTDIDLVLVHDAARPRIGPGVVDRIIAALATVPAAIPVVPVTDTIKEVDESGGVVATLDRARLRAVQTPQGFDRAALLEWHEQFDGQLDTITDDAALAELAGAPVRTVPGDPATFKITTPEDLARAEQLWLVTG